MLTHKRDADTSSARRTGCREGRRQGRCPALHYERRPPVSLHRSQVHRCSFSDFFARWPCQAQFFPRTMFRRGTMFPPATILFALPSCCTFVRICAVPTPHRRRTDDAPGTGRDGGGGGVRLFTRTCSRPPLSLVRLRCDVGRLKFANVDFSSRSQNRC